MFHSRVFIFDSGSFHHCGDDVGGEGPAFVSYDRLRDVRMLSEYLHEGIHCRFRVWLSDRYSEQVAGEVIACRQNARIPV